jgi:carboxyl-terminal processing protease
MATPGMIDIPLVVLVNQHSASASEILAGALKDNKRAVLVGEKTYGKGLVQRVYPLQDGAALKLTIQKYYTPAGTDINEIGINPDYQVENEPNSNNDLQLNKALEVLKKQIY